MVNIKSLLSAMNDAFDVYASLLAYGERDEGCLVTYVYVKDNQLILSGKSTGVESDITDLYLDIERILDTRMVSLESPVMVEFDDEMEELKCIDMEDEVYVERSGKFFPLGEMLIDG